MIQILDKSLCCGCWACANICPKRCIEMKMDFEGFHYPIVDTESCVSCGLCNKVCPIEKTMEDDTKPRSFVIQHKDIIIRRDSTSGGFFTAAARWAIEQGGVVFGAAFDKDMVLRHQYSETLEGCVKFRGSKYLQSLIGESYKVAKSFLTLGRIVVFSGTPCQIAGLHHFLGSRKYNHLLTVDLVCHGVPSPRLASEYFTYNSFKVGSSVVDYRSRDKYYGYSYSTATIIFRDKCKQYHKGKESDFMLGLYFKDLISRPSCYTCHFKTLHRVSDITIFDCWDAPSVSNKFDRSGATNVFVHTPRGKEMFEALKRDFIWSESDIEPVIKRDGIMIKNRVMLNPRRNELFQDLNNNLGIEDIAAKYLPTTMKNRILSSIKPLLFKFGIFDLYMNLKK